MSAIITGNKLSEDIAEFLRSGRLSVEMAGHAHPQPVGDDDEDWIDTGAGILNFYCTLVDLLGRCAPEASVIAQGKNDSLRARAILRSLVPLEDLQGVLSLRFNVEMPEPGMSGSGGSDMPHRTHPEPQAEHGHVPGESLRH